MSSDEISDFQDLLKNYNHKLNFIPWESKIINNVLCFYILNLDSTSDILCSVKIDSSLKVAIHIGKNKL